jgi:hypothetical protein
LFIGIFLMGLGAYIFMNSKEDEIEAVKKKSRRRSRK